MNFNKEEDGASRKNRLKNQLNLRSNVLKVICKFVKEMNPLLSIVLRQNLFLNSGFREVQSSSNFSATTFLLC